jgi:hypoxanthine phosphoribosyltransferase
MKTRVLFDEAKLQARIAELGHQITRDFQGEDLIVVGVLKGAFVFLADLIRHIKVPQYIEFIGVSSYKGTESTGHVQITRDLMFDIEGKNVLLVEDIVDTGRTVDFLLDIFRIRKPKSIQVCTLLAKPDKHQMHNPIAYTGFTISNEFVIGYGLDLDGKYRELSHIAQVIG